MKILLLIRSLNAGGAERQLVVTAKGLAQRGHNVTVLTFYAGGFYASALTDTTVQLLDLQKKGRWDLVGFLWRLWRGLRRQSPDVIYSFLGTPNILSVAMRPFIAPVRLIWGVRASNMDLDQYDWLSRFSYLVECKLARFADKIIANSHAGMEYAIAHGFPENKMMVIPNGIDTDHFHPDKTAGKKLREQWGIGKDESVIGAVGRIDPMKGIPTFLEAARMLRLKHPNTRFVWVGSGNADYEKKMKKIATELNLDDVLIWAERHTDMVAVYNAFDIASSSSYGEGFPNVIGEAMACGVPCVVTDVGDTILIVGNAGVIVPPGDGRALSQAWHKMITLNSDEKIQLSIAGRERIRVKFSVKMMIATVEKTLINSCRETR